MANKDPNRQEQPCCLASTSTSTGETLLGATLLPEWQALNPWGAAARVVAELAACAVELRQLENIRILGEQEIAERRVWVTWLFDELRRRTERHQLVLEDIQQGYRAIVAIVTDRSVPADELQIYSSLALEFSSNMLAIVRSEQDALLAHHEKLVNLSAILKFDSAAAIAAQWRQVDRPVRQIER